MASLLTRSSDTSRGVVSALCVGLAETINKIGPGFIEGRTYLAPRGRFIQSTETEAGIDTICRIAAQILEQKALCQQDPDQDEEEEAPEDQAEYDSVLISSAADLVSSLANALGPDFARIFSNFFPLIAKYYVSLFSVI